MPPILKNPLPFRGCRHSERAERSEESPDETHSKAKEKLKVDFSLSLEMTGECRWNNGFFSMGGDATHTEKTSTIQRMSSFRTSEAK